MRTLDFWRATRDVLARGAPAFLTLVADHTRHSPGTRGAHLMLAPGAAPVGTVGGGVMEKHLLERGAAALAAGEFTAEVRELYHRREAPGETSGMICAGQQTNVSALALPERDLAAVEQVVARLEADAPGLLTITPGEGLGVEDATPRRDEAPVRLVGDADAWRYEEQLLDTRRAVIFGAGHCGLALSRQLDLLDHVVTVADTRADVPTLTANTHARHRIITEDYAAAAAQVSHPELTFALVMTADFPSDTRALEGALRQPFPFIGVMGAPAKLRAIRAALTTRGFGEEDLARLTAPVGVPISSSTPAEIAVSVAAQLIALRPEVFPACAPSPFRSREDQA